MRFLFYLLIPSFISITNAQSYEVYADNNLIKVNEQNDNPLDLGLSTYKFSRITYTGKPISINIKVTDLNSEKMTGLFLQNATK